MSKAKTRQTHRPVALLDAIPSHNVQDAHADVISEISL